MGAALKDVHDRPLRSLRLSVTDRCNLRCSYCMPESDYVWLERSSLLTFEEIETLVLVFLDLGVQKIRITGGEPLLRRQLFTLVERLAQDARILDLALTTNGVRLREQALGLKAAGLSRITISLDTLERWRFFELTKRDAHNDVMAGIKAAQAAGFQRTKIDTVVMRGVNDDEILPLLQFAESIDAEIRFIEYMDVGGATRWHPRSLMSAADIRSIIERARGVLVPLPNEDAAPANRYRLENGTTFGIVASMTEPFCRTCDRARLTADGHFFMCLYAADGLDLLRLVRGGASASRIADHIRGAWSTRTDRGAERRRGLVERRPLVGLGELRRNPHLEMHKRGG